MRLFPKSLTARLLLVLLGGLVAAQLAGAAILLRDRASALYEASGLHAVQRIVTIVRALDGLGAQQRPLLLRAVGDPGLRVRLAAEPPPLPEEDAPRAARRLERVLGRMIGDDRPVRVSVLERPAGRRSQPRPVPFSGPPPPGMAPTPGPGFPPGPGDAAEPWRWQGETDDPRWQAWREAWREGWERPGGVHFWREGRRPLRLVVAVRLADGPWAVFATRPPEEPFLLPASIPVALAVLLAAVVAVSLLAVRLLVRPLAVLGEAADELGRNIDRPPLPEDGPAEVARAARAFNTMQARIARYVKDRERMLAAVSHDLRTPITRLRLRAEMLDDEVLRGKLLGDLAEMEAMVESTLGFMRDAAREEAVVPVNLQALMESLATDLEEGGARVTLSGTFPAAFPARPMALRRCLDNLLGNAVTYGGAAEVSAREDATGLTLTVADRGPGIPEAELERVFEPFLRLEPSRSRETGGVGLGLSIARTIARAHGGELVLRNRDGGGLEAVLTLPR